MPMTTHGILAPAVTAILGCACAAVLALPAPALAAPVLPAPALAAPALAESGPGSGQPPAPSPPPPAGSGPYSHAVGSATHTTGDVRPGGALAGAYVPPQCWLEPRFTSTQSWHRFDPRSYNDYFYDADTYWWSFAANETNLIGTIVRTRSRQLVNQTFMDYQRSGTKGWWWVPAWLQDPQGLACAKGLVSNANLNNGFLAFEPPQPMVVVPGHTLDGRVLADIARAALALPRFTVHTNPVGSPTRPSDVNLPVWVWVTYHGPARPQDMTSVQLPGGATMWARVSASRPSVSISVSAPGQAVVYSHCGSTGSRYTGQAGSVPSCGVTFLAPSVGGPYTLTVTVRWTVTWSDSTGATGGFPSPPYPPSRASRSVSVTTREIQSVNGGG